MLDNRETNSCINSLILPLIFWTLVAAIVLLTASGCAQIQTSDAGTETGDVGTQPVFEGGALAPYRCLRDPRGRAGIGEPTDAPWKLWLDSSELYECYSDVGPPCRAVGSPGTVYVCSTAELKLTNA